MGMFNDNSNSPPVPGGSLAKPVLIALGALLVGKMLSGKHEEPEAAAPSHPDVPQSEASGGLLGSVLGGGLGGILGGLGGLLGGAANNPSAPPAPGGLSGGLGGLLEQLTQAGHGNTVDSWVGNGNNASIAPDQLGNAIGQKTLSEIAQHAGINEQELLSQLSQVLPGLIDKLTANGKVPDVNEIAQLLQRR